MVLIGRWVWTTNLEKLSLGEFYAIMSIKRQLPKEFPWLSPTLFFNCGDHGCHPISAETGSTLHSGSFSSDRN
jgi:hypothetical protein